MLKIIIIEGTREDMISLLSEFNFDEFRVKPFIKKTDIETAAESNKRVIIRDKICDDCDSPFYDSTPRNRRKWCDKCWPAHDSKPRLHGFAPITPLKEPVKAEKKPAAKEKKPATVKPLRPGRPKAPKAKKVLIDNTQNGELKKAAPAINRPVIILKSNERICRNPDCKKIYAFSKLEQQFCSAQCEKHYDDTYRKTKKRQHAE